MKPIRENLKRLAKKEKAVGKIERQISSGSKQLISDKELRALRKMLGKMSPEERETTRQQMIDRITADVMTVVREAFAETLSEMGE